MNIVFIVIDTLRYDYIGANGNEWIETPHLDRIADRAWVSDRSYAASYPTIPHRTDVPIAGDATTRATRALSIPVPWAT